MRIQVYWTNGKHISATRKAKALNCVSSLAHSKATILVMHHMYRAKQSVSGIFCAGYLRVIHFHWCYMLYKYRMECMCCNNLRHTHAHIQRDYSLTYPEADALPIRTRRTRSPKPYVNARRTRIVLRDYIAFDEWLVARAMDLFTEQCAWCSPCICTVVIGTRHHGN